MQTFPAVDLPDSLQRVELSEPDGGICTLTLRGNVDVSVAADLCGAARRAAASDVDVVIRAGDVERLDLSAVQVLIALGRALPKTRTLRFASLSEAGRRSLDLSGAAPELAPPDGTPPALKGACQ